MRMEVNLNKTMKIENMACLYHAMTSLLSEHIPIDALDVFIGYDGTATICGSSYDYCIVVSRKWKSHDFTIDGPYDPADYGVVIYDEECFYGLSLLETCRLLLDVKDEFDV